MIDLSLMRGVHVDRRARRARVEGGALWRDVNRETQQFGLAVTGGAVSSTGVAGLTLGGGLGWLMPKYGMALDNVTSMDLVTAKSEVVRAASDEHPDLFWGARGGGGNFGVAASFEFALHEVGPMITGGLVAYPFDKARDVLRFYRDLTSAGVPEEMLVLGAMLTGPDGSKLVGIAAGHCGSLEDGGRAVAPIKQFGQPVLDVLGPIPYSALNMMLDGSFPAGARSYWKSHFLPALDDAAIDALIDQFAQVPSPMSQLLLEHFHGAPTRVAPTETSYALRAGGYNVAIVSQWAAAADDGKGIAWAKGAYDALRPFMGPSRYLNYLGDDDNDDDALTAVYGPNVKRLRKVKGTYDPDNVFHLNVNIKP
jgi:FAD/FMN-containing dehydrogenase